MRGAEQLCLSHTALRRICQGFFAVSGICVLAHTLNLKRHASLAYPLHASGPWCWSRLHEYEQAVSGQASEAGADAELAQVLWQLGCVLSEQARWANAQTHLQRSLALLESLEHCNALDIACVCNGEICSLKFPSHAQETHHSLVIIAEHQTTLCCSSLVV